MNKAEKLFLSNLKKGGFDKIKEVKFINDTRFDLILPIGKIKLGLADSNEENKFDIIIINDNSEISEQEYTKIMHILEETAASKEFTMIQMLNYINKLVSEVNKSSKYKVSDALYLGAWYTKQLEEDNVISGIKGVNPLVYDFTSMNGVYDKCDKIFLIIDKMHKLLK